MESQEPHKPAHKGCSVCGFLGDGSAQVCPNDGSVLTAQTLLYPQHPGQQASDPQSRIGSMVGDHYLLTEFVGEGGMSLVYKARQLPLERVVAIKLLKRTGDSSDIRYKRFFQEAKAVSSLSHPNIINVLDFGVSSDGVAYMVMEFIEGLSLAQYLEQSRKTDAKHFVHIFSQACDALEHAHQKGILHRDVKPSNMMLVNSLDDKEFLKILDFGIAKLLPWAEPGQQKLTQTGEVFGSPLYMSPEQCLGKEIDVRSDIYALGCVMYEVATGKPPVVGLNILDTMHKQVDEEPQPFSSASTASKDFQQFEPVILKALEKEPHARQQSMEELRLELVKVIAGPSNRQLPPVNLRSLAPLRFLRRKKQRKLLTAMACLLLVPAVAMGSIKVYRIWQTSKQPAFNWGRLTESGIAALQKRNYERAETAFKRALEEAEHFKSTDDRLEISLKNLRNVYRAEGNFRQASILDSQITKFKQKRLRAQYGGTAASFKNLADLTLSAIPKDPLKGAGNNEETADTLTSLAAIASEQDDPSRAELLLKAALDLDEREFGPRSWQVALKLNDLAFFYLKQDQYAKAKPLIKKALPIMQEALAAEQSRSAGNRMNENKKAAGSQPGFRSAESDRSADAYWLDDYKRLLRSIERNEQASAVEGHAQTMETESKTGASSK